MTGGNFFFEMMNDRRRNRACLEKGSTGIGEGVKLVGFGRVSEVSNDAECGMRMTETGFG